MKSRITQNKARREVLQTTPVPQGYKVIKTPLAAYIWTREASIGYTSPKIKLGMA